MSGAAAREPLVLTLQLPGIEAALRQAGFAFALWKAEDVAGALALAPHARAVVTLGVTPLPPGFLDAARQLSLVCCLGAGYEHYDPAALAQRGVRLANGGGANAEDVADLAMGLIIAARRRIVQADAWVRAGQWMATPVLSHRLRGQRLGIVGLGSIGRAVAARAAAFGMEIAWHGPTPKPVEWRYFDDVTALAHWADVLAVCCRPTPENEKLIGAGVLEALGPSGVLVNVARGSLVDEGALIAALRDGRLGGAALDVFAREPTDPEQWKDVPNLTLHPHRGGATVEALAQACDLVVENLRRHFAGEQLVTPLN